MNLTKSLLILAVTGVLFTGCKQAENAPAASADSNATAVKTETASFSIDGMTCEMGCAKTIEKQLAGMDGVQDAKVDFEKKTATVKFDASKQTTEKIAAVVEAAADGKTYKVSDVKSSGDQAMLYDNEKEKGKKKKNKRNNKGSKENCSPEMEAKKGTPACCAAKKACHA